uniref:Uncharacterized protein n=1 Tax=Zea mays TaxID=4577 RepID=A0A804LY44_MAIZE
MPQPQAICRPHNPEYKFHVGPCWRAGYMGDARCPKATCRERRPSTGKAASSNVILLKFVTAQRWCGAAANVEQGRCIPAWGCARAWRRSRAIFRGTALAWLGFGTGMAQMECGEGRRQVPLLFEGLRGGFSQLRKQFKRGSAGAHFFYRIPFYHWI